MEANAYRSIQFINEDNKFNVAEMEKFVKDVKLDKYGLSYSVVSIIGPQSSGKSTLLNHLFNTGFQEMDPIGRRCQTTQGIWLANSSAIEPCTLVLDIEGSDGKERENDTTFERRTALLALAVSDVVIINMWCHDIGRAHAASRPLLKTVFQVMTQLFGASKTTLMFMLRDKTKNRLELIEEDLRKDVNEMWDSISKPKALKETPLTDFFNIEVVALSSYEQNEEEFKEQVDNLRKRFFDYRKAGEERRRRDIVPSSGFSFSVQQIWKKIMENKDLDLPAHNVMVAIVRCEEIGGEKLAAFKADEGMCQIVETANSQAVPNFGKKLTSIIQARLSEYDDETAYFDDGIRTKKRKALEADMLQLVQPAYRSMLEHIGSQFLNIFKEEFGKAWTGGKAFVVVARNCIDSITTRFNEACKDIIIKQANWDSSKENSRFQRDLDAHVVAVRHLKLNELYKQSERELIIGLSGRVEPLLHKADDNTWPEIRNLLKHENELVVSRFSTSISCFGVDKQTELEMLQKLKNYGRLMVEQKAREAADGVLVRMTERFMKSFIHDINSRLRTWSMSENHKISTFVKSARSASLKLLSVMAAIRLDGEADNIKNTLCSALMADNKSTASPELLASTTWQTIPSSETLITPLKCRSLWGQFNQGIEPIICEAREAVKKKRLEDTETALTITVAATSVIASLASGLPIFLG